MASPGSTPGGVKASSSETFDRGVDVSRSTGGRDWGGATFGDPRTPEKAQRRLGGLTKKRKKKKKKKKKNLVERYVFLRRCIEVTYSISFACFEV